MNVNRQHPRRQSGFSLVEMMIATVALVIMSAGIVGVSQIASSSLDTNNKVLSTHVAGKRALERMQRHIRAASWSTTMSSAGTDEQGEPMMFTIEELVDLGDAGPYEEIQFQTYIVNPVEPDGMPILSAPFSLFVRASQTDAANGVDDDGDGLIDEEELVLDPPDTDPVVIASDVTSFQISPNSRTLEFVLECGTTQSNGNVLTQISTLSVELRND